MSSGRTIFADQERLRNNLSSLGKTKEDQALRKRYLDQLARARGSAGGVACGDDTTGRPAANTLKEMVTLIDTLTFMPESAAIV
jgi:hypothetical protein